MCQVNQFPSSVFFYFSDKEVVSRLQSQRSHFRRQEGGRVQGTEKIALFRMSPFILFHRPLLLCPVFSVGVGGLDLVLTKGGILFFFYIYIYLISREKQIKPF